MKSLRAFLLAGLCLVAVRPVIADFDDLGMGARAMGMGDAFTGLADDSRAIYYNPAGLAWQRQAQLGADYSRFQMGLDDKSELSLGFVSYSQPLFKFEPKEKPKPEVPKVPEMRTLTVEGKTIQVPSTPDEVSSSTEPRRSEKPLVPPYGTLGVAMRNFNLSGAYQENSYYLSYARNMFRRWSWGTTLKFLQESYTQDAYTQIDPVFAGHNGKSGVSTDLGVMWNYRARFFWGASLLDINRPNVGLGQKEKLPATYKTGFGYKDPRNAAAVDITSRNGEKRFGGGLEHWMGHNKTAIRLGLDLGQRSQFNATFGFSIRVAVFQIDYGFMLPMTGVTGTAGTHRLSFVYRIGRPPKDEVEAGSLEASYYDLKDENEDLQVRLKKAEYERDHLEHVLVEEATQHIRERITYATAVPGGAKRPAVNVQLQTHVVHSGDTLKALAYEYYQDASRWKEIYEANRDKIGRGGRLKSGTLLLIPGKTAQTPGSNAPEKSSAAPVAAPAQPQEQSSTDVDVSSPTPPVLIETVAIKHKKPHAAGKITKAKPEPEPVQKFHTVKSGETLQSIAQQHYGDPKRWVEIYKANKSKISRGSVEAGQVLVIP